MSILIRILISALALLVAANFVPGIAVNDLYTAIVAAVILGILNVIVRPILLIFTFPITIVTLGLFTFVINAALFLFVASFIEGFHVDGFVPALVGSVIVSIISAFGNKFVS